MTLLHPAIVHFPVAFFVLATTCFCYAHLRKREQWFEFAWVVWLAGYFLSLLSLVTGIWDSGGIGNRPRPHSTFGFAFVISYALLAFVVWRVRQGKLSPQKALLSIYLLAAIGGGLLLLTAYTGGEVVVKMIIS